MKKTAADLIQDYKKKYLDGPGANDHLKASEIQEIMDMAQGTAKDRISIQYYLIVFAFFCGFMKGYHRAELDRRKKGSKAGRSRQGSTGQ